MADNKINFTENALKKLPIPKEGEKTTIFYDLQIKGLMVMVFPSGNKTFYLSKKIKGKAYKIKIGRFPDVTVINARKKAGNYLTKIANDENPQKEKKSLGSEATFEDLFKKYLVHHAKQHKKTWEEDERQYNSHLTDWRRKKISSITYVDVRKKINSIGIELQGSEARPYAANRLLSLISKVYNFALEERLYSGENPALGIKKFKEHSRDRFLHPDELPKFFTSLGEEPNTIVRDYIYTSLLTGARKANVLSMKWEDINFERMTWYIEETKNGTSQTIPLTEQALDILKTRKRLNCVDEGCGNKWVFPSKTSKSGHLEEPKKVWKKIITRAGLTNLRLHDLRRTLGSWQAMTGANSYIIGKTLNHKSTTATSIYARLNLDPVRDSMNTATDAMFNAGKGKKNTENNESTH